MTKHEKKVKAAENAIDSVFSDTSVGQEKTYEDLLDLKEVIDLKLVCLRSDLRRKEREAAREH